MVTLEDYAGKTGLPIIWDRSYHLEEFLRRDRFSGAGTLPLLLLPAPEGHSPGGPGGKFDAFTSTLLYSKFQNHTLIRELGDQVGREVGVPFYYEDFRQGWETGITRSKQMGLYRQQYCGCIIR